MMNTTVRGYIVDCSSPWHLEHQHHPAVSQVTYSRWNNVGAAVILIFCADVCVIAADGSCLTPGYLITNIILLHRLN